MDKPWKVILAFTGIFVAGILVGGLVTLRWGKNVSQRQPMGEQFGPQLMDWRSFGASAFAVVRFAMYDYDYTVSVQRRSSALPSQRACVRACVQWWW